jgi:hypothetical protein
LFQRRINRLGQRHCRWKASIWTLRHSLLDNRVERLNTGWQRWVGLSQTRRRTLHVRVAQVGGLGSAEGRPSGQCGEENRAEAVNITLLRKLSGE